MSAREPILIAGAGIGGLTAALALLRAGYAVRVFEQAAKLAEVGAGVQISANGNRVLFGLGLGEVLQSLAWVPDGKEVRLWNTGETWNLFDLGAESVARYGFPYLMLHRADLHSALADAVMRLDPDCIRLGARCAGFADDGDRVRLRLANGDSAVGAALIGADGVHSVIRQALFGADKPKFTGMMAWRGVVPADRLPAGMLRPKGTNWVGPGGHVIHYFLRRGELFNFVGVRERRDWTVESWTAAGTVDECLADYAGWHPDIHAMIRGIETPFKWALMARDPMPRWSVGRVTLLGDACHPMLPFLAQGANSAIEDGMVLTNCLKAHGRDVPAALAAYEAARRERTARLQKGSAANTDLFHNPVLADGKGAGKFVTENWAPDRVKARYDWIFDYDATRDLVAA
jgi:salicylate hydroxylase